MTTVTEIAPDVYRISAYESNFKLQFNHFLVKDKEPLLFHAGSFAGDGGNAIRNLASAMKDVLGKEQ